jgi:hypothetical protein
MFKLLLKIVLFPVVFFSAPRPEEAQTDPPTTPVRAAVIT